MTQYAILSILFQLMFNLKHTDIVSLWYLRALIIWLKKQKSPLDEWGKHQDYIIPVCCFFFTVCGALVPFLLSQCALQTGLCYCRSRSKRGWGHEAADCFEPMHFLLQNLLMPKTDRGTRRTDTARGGDDQQHGASTSSLQQLQRNPTRPQGYRQSPL